MLVFLAVHIASSVLDPYASIHLIDALMPFAASYRPLWLGLGALAFDLLLALAITSVLRARLGLRWWRGIHWLAYACWPIALVHALGTGSDVRASWFLWLAAASVVTVVASACWRLAETPSLTVRWRVVAACAVLLAPLALLGWLESGPLRAGWAAHAGTPAPLLRHAGLALRLAGARVTSAVHVPAHDRSARHAPPSGLPRLLAGWYEQRRPAALADHVARYGELPRVSANRATALIDEIERAGLTGRGGAGFPTHRKLRAVRAQGRRPIVVANGMEGEPASAKDRLLLSVAPHLVLDGAELAAAAIGAEEIHVCVPRGPSSPLAALEHALDERARAGRRSACPIRVSLPSRALRRRRGDVRRQLAERRPGETDDDAAAAVRARGARTPDPGAERRDPRPSRADRGSAPPGSGTRATDDPGSLLLSVSRPEARLAVHETALGTTIGQVAAASRLEQETQAVLVGGYFGTWLPWSEAIGLPLTHAHLEAAEGALGAGILAFLPAGACGLCETARVARYLAGQSARQCGPCQHGLPAVANDLALICHGTDATARERAARRMRQIEGRGACRHPDGMVRLVRSALRVFSEHVAWHERHGPCPGMHRTPLLPAARREHDEEWR